MIEKKENSATTLDEEISILRKYLELLQPFDLSENPSHVKSTMENFLNDFRLLKEKYPSFDRRPLTGQAREEVLQLITKHFQTLDPRYSPQELMKALEKSGPLGHKAQAIYESYRTELGLKVYPDLQGPESISFPLYLLTNKFCFVPAYAIADLVFKLEGLKHKKEREAETPPQTELPKGKDTETPASLAERSVKASFSTVERIVTFLGSLATIGTFLLYIYPKFDFVLTWTDIIIIMMPLVLILELAVSIATLIMFAYWLRLPQK